jgi:hypothetical protein
LKSVSENPDTIASGGSSSLLLFFASAELLMPPGGLIVDVDEEDDDEDDPTRYFDAGYDSSSIWTRGYVTIHIRWHNMEGMIIIILTPESIPRSRNTK